MINGKSDKAPIFSHMPTDIFSEIGGRVAKKEEKLEYMILKKICHPCQSGRIFLSELSTEKA